MGKIGGEFIHADTQFARIEENALWSPLVVFEHAPPLAAGIEAIGRVAVVELLHLRAATMRVPVRRIHVGIHGRLRRRRVTNRGPAGSIRG